VPPAAMLTGILVDRMLGRGALAKPGCTRLTLKLVPLTLSRGSIPNLVGYLAGMGLSALFTVYGFIRIFPGSISGFRANDLSVRPASLPLGIASIVVGIAGAIATVWKLGRAAEEPEGDSPEEARSRRHEDLMLGGIGIAAAIVVALTGRDLAANPAASGNERATPDVAPTASDVTFTSGDERQFPTDMPVEVSDMPEIAGGSGTLSFWLQPTWEGDNQDDASLLELGDGRLRVVKNVDFLRFEWMDDAGTSGGIGAPIVDWKPGEWHAVTTTWNGSSFALYIDGRLVSAKDDAGRVGLPADSTLVIGSNFAESRPVAPGLIGKVDVRRRPLSPAEVANQFAAAAGNRRP